MIRAFVFLAIFFLTQSSYAQRNPENSSYVDPKLGLVAKVQPLTWISGYVMGGVELPVGGNRYVDLNVGIPNVGVTRDQTSPGGVLVRGGLMLPLRHTSPFSIFYWMPQFNWGTYVINNYYCYSCTPQVTQGQRKWGTQWAATVDFGYRHVNPATYFFYEAGVSAGYGAFNYSSVNFNYGQTGWGNPLQSGDGGYTSLMVSSHIAIGLAFKRKDKN